MVHAGIDSYSRFITYMRCATDNRARLRQDMHHCTMSVYYRLFYHMEQNGSLNPLDAYHLFALHYVYLPRINQSLEIFCDGWNNHGVRSEHHQTPLQLFTAGVINLGSSDSDDIHNLSSYGVEEAGLVPATDDEEQ